MNPQQFQIQYQQLVEDFHSRRIDWNVFEARLFELFRQRAIQAVAEAFAATQPATPPQPAREPPSRPALPDMRAVADSLAASMPGAMGRFHVDFADEASVESPRAADFGFSKTFFMESNALPPSRDFRGTDPFSGIASGVTRRVSRFTPGVMLAGAYRLQRPLGMGQCGETWRAEETQTGNYVVIKPLPQAFQNDRAAMKRFYRDVRRVAALRHPGICSPLGVGLDRMNGVFLVEPFLDARYLDEYYEQYCETFQGFPVSEALRLLRPMGEALDYAHRKGVAHRMLKPQNVLIGRHCGVMLTDFQLTQTVRAELSQQGIGTEAADLSPWQASEIWTDNRFGPEADQFALAALAVKLLTGKLPFSGRNTSEIREAILRGEPAGLDGVSGPISGVLEKALSKEPGDRYPGVRVFLDELSAALTAASDSGAFGAGEIRDESRPWPFPEDDSYDVPIAPGSTYPYTVPPQRVRGVFPWRKTLALAAVLLLFVSGSVALAIWHGNDRPAETAATNSVPETADDDGLADTPAVVEAAPTPVNDDAPPRRRPTTRRLSWGAKVVPVKTEELPELTQQALDGEVEAQRRLGEVFFYGKGVTADYPRAFEYFSLGAEQDDPVSIYHVGRCYELGLGVQKSVVDAIEYYRHGVKLGSEESREALKRLRVEE